MGHARSGCIMSECLQIFLPADSESYMDDVWSFRPNHLLENLRSAGFITNDDKFQRGSPAIFLGWNIDLKKYRANIPKKRAASLFQELSKFKDKPDISLNDIQIITGKIESLCSVYSHRWQTFHLMSCLKQAQMSFFITLSEGAISELNFWINVVKNLGYCDLNQVYHHNFASLQFNRGYTDATPSTYGLILCHNLTHFKSNGVVPAPYNSSIATAEAFGVLSAIKEMAPNSSWELMVDNTNVISTWNLGRSRNRLLNDLIGSIKSLCDSKKIQISLVYIPSGKFIPQFN